MLVKIEIGDHLKDMKTLWQVLEEHKKNYKTIMIERSRKTSIGKGTKRSST